MEIAYPDGSGSIRVREYYAQLVGDWSIWFRVIIDIDTSDAYFFYISSKCLGEFSDADAKH